MGLLLPGFQWQAFEVALWPTNLHQKAHHDILCHQKMLLNFQLAEAAVKGEEKRPKPGHEQDVCGGFQEL